VFLIYNTTSTAAAHRAVTMAHLRVIGAEGARLFRLLMLEALVLAGCGAAAGIVLGIGLAALLIGMVAESMAVIFKVRFPVESLAIEPFTQGIIVVAGVGAGLFASYFAARRIERMEPLVVLHPEAHAADDPPRLRSLVVWWLVLTTGSALMLFVGQRSMSIVWGNLGATLWNASIILIAIPLVMWSARVVSPVLAWVLPAEGEVAAHGLFRAPRRTGITVAAIALVVTTAVVLTSLSQSFRDSVRGYVEQLFAADLIVSAHSTDGGWAETPLPAALADELARIPGVASVETAQMLAGQAFRGERIGVLALSEGLLVPERYAASLYRNGDPIAAARALRAGTAVNVSTALADFFRLSVGDEIVLDTPGGALAVPIVGVVADFISDRGSVILSRRLFERWWKDSNVRRFNLYLQPGASAEATRAAVRAQFEDRYRLKILSLPELLEYHEVYRRQAFAFTDAIQLLIVIVTVAGIFDLLLSAIIERKRELAYWRLIGADESAVRRSVMLESLAIGTLGAVLGVAVSVVTAWIWITINFPNLLGYQLEFTFPLGSTVWYVTLVLVMTVLAGYLAASRAIRSSILEGIQVE
jgi:putative ABC transport system permease protein